MPDIFISYAHEDSERIQTLGLSLEAKGWSVFWDRNIPTGQTWQSHIGKALGDARCVIVAWSNHSIDSSWVYEEAEDGKQRGILIPILLDSIQPPIGFRSIQAADLSDWKAGGRLPRFEQLLNELKSILETTSSQSQTERLAKPKVDAIKPVGSSQVEGQPTYPSRLRYALIALFLSVVVGVGYWDYQRRVSDSEYIDQETTQSTASSETPSKENRLSILKLTPVFGITPGATTRRDVDDLIKKDKLRSLGTVQNRDGDKIEFTFGVITFQSEGEDMDFTRNPFDTVTSMEYWGDESLPLGFRTQMTLDQAALIAGEHFVWLGTQSFRGLVFSSQKDGPILLEISMINRKNPLSYKIFGPL